MTDEQFENGIVLDMKIKMLESGESPDFGPFKKGEIVGVKRKTGETLVSRGLAEEMEMTLADVVAVGIYREDAKGGPTFAERSREMQKEMSKIESKKKGGKDNG